jgi:D-serine deaminase-like pyridoxal phosphate-dependent protein
MLALCQAEDVLMAYQALGPKLARLIALVKKYPGIAFSCLTDNISAAKEQAEAFMLAGLTLPVFIDLNVGMNRTGIEPGLPAIALAEFISKTEGIRLEGLHAYDGHLRDTDFENRKQKCDAAFGLIEKFKTDLAGKGISVNKMIAGGSPTFSIHCHRQLVECSPGTFVYWDKGYADLCPEQPFLPAAILLSRIISFPHKGRICMDLGHKSVAAENDISRRVFFPQAPHFKFVSQSEEHLVVEAGDNHDYRAGDVLYGLPYHICPTVALYEKVYTVDEGRVSGEWRTIARDRKITI